MRKTAVLLLAALVAAGCGARGRSAGATEQYLKSAGGFAEAHCLPGTDGWKYLCTVRRARRVYEVGVKVHGKRVQETTGLDLEKDLIPSFSGNVGIGSATVTVPHDKGSK